MYGDCTTCATAVACVFGTGNDHANVDAVGVPGAGVAVGVPGAGVAAGAPHAGAAAGVPGACAAVGAPMPVLPPGFLVPVLPLVWRMLHLRRQSFWLPSLPATLHRKAPMQNASPTLNGMRCLWTEVFESRCRATNCLETKKMLISESQLWELHEPGS